MPSQRPFSLAVLGAALLAAQPAAAFCRTTTCDPRDKDSDCVVDDNGCIRSGYPLWWERGYAGFYIAAEGSVALGISAEQTEALVAFALERWTSVSCEDDSTPNLNVFVEGQLAGAAVDFDRDNLLNNDSVVVFQDTTWPHDRQAVALTSTTFDARTGQILDADTELNSVGHQFSETPRGPDGVDLLAVLVHELGHSLGLDHSSVPGATMQPETLGSGFVQLRSLEQDDVEGICSIYGPNAVYGPHDDNDGRCSMAHAGSSRGASWPWALLLAFMMMAWARRARPRSNRSALPWQLEPDQIRDTLHQRLR